MKKPIQGQKTQFYSWNQFDKDVDKIVKWVNTLPIEPTCIVTIPNGGLCLGAKLHYRLGIPLRFNECYPEDIVLLCDDICDSGKTMYEMERKLITTCNGIFTVSLFLNTQNCGRYKPQYYVRETTKWIIFPWEV